MTKPFKAGAAKKISQIAQANIDRERETKKLKDIEEKQNRQQRRKNRKKFIKQIYDGWKKQRKLIIAAALQGLNEIRIKPPIYRPSKLIDLDFDITELDTVELNAIQDRENKLIRSKLEKKEQLDNKKWAIVAELRDSIQLIFEEFMADFSASSKSKIAKYYFEFSDFEREQQCAFDNCLASIYGSYDDSEFHVNGGAPNHFRCGPIWYDMDLSITTKYDIKYFQKMNDKIDACTDILAPINLDILNIIWDVEDIENLDRLERDISELDSDSANKFIDGILKHNNAGGSATLFPLSEQNILKLTFGYASESQEGECLMEPIFTWHGLNWLSNFSGQMLLEAIYNQLKSESEKGKDTANLRFKLADEGWYFECPTNQLLCSCVPSELVEIL